MGMSIFTKKNKIIDQYYLGIREKKHTTINVW